MKTTNWRWVLGLAAAVMLLAGCEDNDHHGVIIDDTPPGIPRGVSSITGDELVTVFWFGSSEDDLKGYRVYRSDKPYSGFVRKATIDAGAWDPDAPDYFWEDRDVQNGERWYYAVSAFDFAGNESDLSVEVIYDVPRREGFNVLIDSRDVDNAFTFGDDTWEIDARTVNPSHPDADIVVTYDNGLDALFVEAADPQVIEVQDFGFTDSLDDLDFAPSDGWSGVGWAELIEGHSYVVRIYNRALPNYAKFRVRSMGARWVRIDWAFQGVDGEHQYKRTDSTTVVTVPREGE